MKRTLGGLKREAQAATNFRGHKMIWTTFDDRSHYCDGECRRCGRWVRLTRNPLPNDVHIGGPAVAENCDRVR